MLEGGGPAAALRPAARLTLRREGAWRKKAGFLRPAGQPGPGASLPDNIAPPTAIYGEKEETQLTHASIPEAVTVTNNMTLTTIHVLFHAVDLFQ